MGPICTVAGDLVVVLNHTNPPFIMRSVESGENRCELLGECYCDGVMDGEIVGKSEDQKLYFV